MTEFNRHDLVWLSKLGWQQLYQHYDYDVFHEWEAKALPLIVTRQPQPAPDQEILLGLPLPPAMGKARLALKTQKQHIIAKDQVPQLSHIAHHAPNAWQQSIAALLAIETDLAKPFRVFGSLCWQALTQMPYISQTSDLDLLLIVNHPHDKILPAKAIYAVALQLAEVNKFSPLRIDVELITSQGGVHYQEILRHNQKDMIVKTNQGVALMSFNQWIAADA